MKAMETIGQPTTIESVPMTDKMSECSDVGCCSGRFQLCREVLATKEGKANCEQALKHVKLLVENCDGTPFVFCCCWALKTLVVPTDDGDAYLCAARSPVPDYKHLAYVADLLQKRVEYVKANLWDPVKPFGLDFVEDVIWELGRKEEFAESESFNKKQDVMRTLGFAYENRFPLDVPAFDVVIYNVLEDSKLENNGFNGILRIDVATSISEGVCIARVVIKTIGKDLPKFSMPIIGLAFRDVYQSPRDCLNSGLLRRLGDVVLKSLPDYPQRCQPFALNGHKTWDADVSIYLNSRLTTLLHEDSKRASKVGLDIGNNTVNLSLLKNFREQTEGIKFLRDSLERYARPKVLSMVNEEHLILWSLIVRDFQSALNSIPPQSEHMALWGAWHAAKKIMDFPQRFSPLVPAVVELREEDRIDLLVEDFWEGGSRYKNAIADGFIGRTLTDSKWNEDLLAYYLRSYPTETAEAIVKSVKKEDREHGGPLARQAMNSFFRYCEQKHSSLVEYVEERLYRMTASNIRQIIEDAYAEIAGVFWKSISFGTILGYPIISNIRKRRYHKHRRRELEGIRIGPKQTSRSES
ncbi:MAG: hypothetical protein JXA81_09670 [Sedimentisphaerales bacterium]|nr:hypothetical protein [Sedimentisphaerales bacterium]